MQTSYYSAQEILTLGFKHIGTNVLLSRKCSIYGSENMSIGDNVRIDDFCILSGNITLGNNVHIAAYCGLFAGKTGIVFEDYTGLSARGVIYAESDDYSGNYITNPTVPMNMRHIISGQVILKRHAIVGAGCIILPNCILNEGVAVGAMSLVNKSLDAWSIYVGNPCFKLKNREKNLLSLIQ